MEPVPAWVVGLRHRRLLPDRRSGAVHDRRRGPLARSGYLLFRRLRDSQVRYISLFTDYFALFLLLGIAVSGMLMRYFTRVDIVADQAAGDRAGDLLPGRAGGHRRALLRAPVPGEHAGRPTSRSAS